MSQTEKEMVASLFLASAAEVDSIFESFRELHSIYSSSYTSLEQSLEKLPLQYENQVKNAHKAFDNTLTTVKSRQKRISNQLYAQGLTLLVGNAESLTKEIFQTLLKLNIRKVNIKKNIELPLSDVLKAKTDEQLASLVLQVLVSEGNPAEKLNFQNMQQLQGIMKSYLGFNIDDEIVIELHKFWQIRHVVIHNASIIDQKFIDNLSKARIPTTKYTIGAKVKVTKKDYDSCFSLLVLLFELFDAEIERLELKYNAE